MLIQAAGLCPLLAVSVTLISGFAMGLLVMSVLILTMSTVSALRGFIPYRIRLPAILLISATFITVIHLFIQTFFYGLGETLGIYIPLIAVNSLLLARLEEVALRRRLSSALPDSLMAGLVVLFIVTTTGALREVIGFGTLFRRAGLLFGPSAQDLTITLFSGETGLTVMTMTPGALLLLGLLIAAINFACDSYSAGRRIME